MLIGAALAMVLHGAAPAAAQQVPPPPPPAHIYDPVPGPYYVFLDAGGGIVDPGVLDNAAAGWAGPALSAFSLCIHPGKVPPGNAVSFDALRRVASELHRRGAEIVLIEPAYRCPGPPIPKLAAFTFVEVRGLVRSQPHP